MRVMLRESEASSTPGPKAITIFLDQVTLNARRVQAAALVASQATVMYVSTKPDEVVGKSAVPPINVAVRF
jgi:hypothetical protein